MSEWADSADLHLDRDRSIYKLVRDLFGTLEDLSGLGAVPEMPGGLPGMENDPSSRYGVIAFAGDARGRIDLALSNPIRA